jgi:UDP-N-acetylglucosamine 2-epimerase
MFPQTGCAAGALHVKISPHATPRAWDGSKEHGRWTAAFLNYLINVIETLLCGYVMLLGDTNNCASLSLTDSADLS